MVQVAVRIFGVRWISNDHALTIEWTGTVCLYVNAACNPIVYALTNSRYRDAFVRMIRVSKPIDATRVTSSRKTLWDAVTKCTIALIIYTLIIFNAWYILHQFVPLPFVGEMHYSNVSTVGGLVVKP